MKSSMLVLAAVLVTIWLTGCQTQASVDSIRERADFHFQFERYEQAAEGYGEIISRFPGDWRAQHRYGLTMIELGDLNAARRSLELAHSLRPGNDEIAAVLAEVMFQQGDETQLFAFLRQRAESTQSVDAYRAVARYAMEMGDPDSARVAIRTAIALDEGRSVEPYLDAARYAEELGDLDEAIRRLRQALSINRHDERVRSRLRALGEVPGPTLALPPGR